MKLERFESSNLLSAFLILCSVGTTIAVNPWTAYDPINLPKFAVLVTCAGGVLAIIVFNFFCIEWKGNVAAWLIVSLLIGFLAAFLLSDRAKDLQLWGAWGRSTGLLTYFSLGILSFGASLFTSRNTLALFFRALTLTSYFVTGYTIIQYAQLDPINWSQRLPMATLGNINFMSSFLGLASVLFLSRIFHESIAWTSKAFLILLILLNGLLIVASESIQGLGVFLTGATVITLQRISLKKSFKFTLGIASTLLASGSLILVSMAGTGPLGEKLVQQTVIYRIDYWIAGIRMFLSSPIIGLGFDSYGDYYREFRTPEAAISGPQRITNTAHNVFIDYLVSGGLIIGLPFIVITIFALITSWRTLHRANKLSQNLEILHLAPLIAGWVVFAMISIGQIGITSWGSVLVGLGLRSSWFLENQNFSPERFDDSKKLKRDTIGKDLGAKKSNNNTKDLKVTTIIRNSLSLRFQKVLVMAFCCLSLLLSLIPIRADIEMLKAVKSKNVEEMVVIASKLGSMNFHKEKALVEIRNQGMGDLASNLARDLLLENPRFFDAYVELAINTNNSTEDRKKAAEMLLRLDPSNPVLREEINSLKI